MNGQFRETSSRINCSRSTNDNCYIVLRKLFRGIICFVPRIRRQSFGEEHHIWANCAVASFPTKSSPIYDLCFLKCFPPCLHFGTEFKISSSEYSAKCPLLIHLNFT